MIRLASLLEELRLIRQEVPVPQSVPEPNRTKLWGSLLASRWTTQKGLSLEGMPSIMINCGAWAAATRGAFTLHDISDGAIGIVNNTDLRSWPVEPPSLLTRPFLISSRSGRPLFGSTVDLAGYPLDGRLFLIGLDTPDGAWVVNLCPDWGTDDLDTGEYMAGDDLHLPTGEEQGEHEARAKDGLRFASILGILMGAEQTPLDQTLEGKKKKRETSSPKKKKEPKDSPKVPWREWSIVTVKLSRASRQGKGSRKAAIATAQRQVDRSHLVESEVTVRGHLRRQAVGPQWSERRWIYVAPYQTHRLTEGKRRIRIEP